MQDTTQTNDPQNPQERVSEAPPESLEEAMRRRLRDEVNRSGTVLEAGQRIAQARQEVTGDGQNERAGEVLARAEENLQEATARGGAFALRTELPGGTLVQGQSRLGSGDAELRRAAFYKLDTEEGGDRVARLIAHESEHAFDQNSEGIGDIADPSTGRVVRGIDSIEGLTVTKTDPNQRDPVPYETYGEGRDFVERAGVNTVARYVEKGANAGDTVAYQADIIRRYDSGMEEARVLQLAQAAGFTEEEQKELFAELHRDLPPELREEGESAAA